MTLKQIIFLRAGNGRNIIQNGNLAMGEGNKIFSFSEELVKDKDVYDVHFYNTYVGTAKPFYIKISQIDKRESFTENSYSYYLPAKGQPVFIESRYIPREFAKDGRGTFINYGIVGQLDYYPCVYFDSPSLAVSRTVSGREYKIDITSKADDIEYYEYRYGEVPEYLEEINTDTLEMNSEYSFKNIGKFIKENGYEETLKNAVSFVIRQMKAPVLEKEFVIIRDTEMNIRKWIAAIGYALPISAALQLPFATRLNDCSKKGNLYFIDQHGRYLVTGRNEQKRVLALIVGAESRDPNTKTIRPLPFSEFSFLEDLAENCIDEYFDAITKFDMQHFNFCQDFLAGSSINAEELDMPALYNLYHFFENISNGPMDMRRLYLNLQTADRYNIINISNYEVLKKYVLSIDGNSVEELTRREFLKFLAIVNKIAYGVEGSYDSDLINTIYSNLYIILIRIFQNGEIITPEELIELWDIAASISESFRNSLKEHIFTEENICYFKFKYHLVTNGKLRDQVEAEAETVTILTLLRFYCDFLTESGQEISKQGVKYVFDGLYALYITLGAGDIQYDELIEIIEEFSATEINQKGIELFREIKHDNEKFKDCVYKCTISSRTYENMDDILFECQCYNNFDDIEKFISQMLASKKCPVTEPELYKQMVDYAYKYKQIARSGMSEEFIYPAGLKYFEKYVLRSEKAKSLEVIDKLSKLKPSLPEKSKMEIYQLIGERITYNYDKNNIDILLSNKLFDLGIHSPKIDLLVLFEMIRSYQSRNPSIFPKLSTIYNSKSIGDLEDSYFDNLIDAIKHQKMDTRVHVFILFMLTMSNNTAKTRDYVMRLWNVSVTDGFVLYSALVKTIIDFESYSKSKSKPLLEYYKVIFDGTDLSHESVLKYFNATFSELLKLIYASLSEKEQKYFHRNFNKQDDLIEYFKKNIIQ